MSGWGFRATLNVQKLKVVLNLVTRFLKNKTCKTSCILSCLSQLDYKNNRGSRAGFELKAFKS